MRHASLTLTGAIVLLLGGGSATALPLPSAPRCQVFPRSNPWNQRVDQLPVAANSDAIIASIGARTGLHADFGSGRWQGRRIGIPITVVTAASDGAASRSSTPARAIAARTRSRGTSGSRAGPTATR